MYKNLCFFNNHNINKLEVNLLEGERMYVILVKGEEEDNYYFYSILEYVNDFANLIRDKKDWILYEINRGMDEGINISRLLKLVNYDIVNSNIITDINPKLIGSGLN